MTATKPDGVKPLFFHAQSEKEEADWISGEIKKLLSEGISADQIAVLYRAHYLSRSLEESFMRNSVPYKIYSGIEFYARAEIKDCIAYLRMLSASDDIAFLRTINLPSRKIGKKKLEFLKTVAESENCSLYEALKRTCSQDVFKGTGAKRYLYAIESVKACVGRLPLGALLQKIMDLSGYENYLRLQSDQERLDNIAELKRAVDEAGTDPDATLDDFLTRVALLSNLDGKEKRQAVKLMTIHTAKGMEFQYVFICGMNEGVFPSRKIMTAEDMDEERRLAYVAMTRAIKGLFLSDSEGFSNDNVFKLPSRFIFDAGKENLTFVRELPQSFESRTKRLASRNEEVLRHVAQLRTVHPPIGIIDHATVGRDVDNRTVFGRHVALVEHERRLGVGEIHGTDAGRSQDRPPFAVDGDKRKNPLRVVRSGERGSRHLDTPGFRVDLGRPSLRYVHQIGGLYRARKREGFLFAEGEQEVIVHVGRTQRQLFGIDERESCRRGFRDDDGRLAVGQREDHFGIAVLHVGEDRIAARTFGLDAHRGPLLSAVGRHLPLFRIGIDAQLRSDAVRAFGLDLMAVDLDDLTVERPIVEPLLAFYDGKCRDIGPACAVGNRHLRIVRKMDGIAVGCLDDGSYRHILLQGLHQFLNRLDVRVGISYSLFQDLHPPVQIIYRTPQILVVIRTTPCYKAQQGDRKKGK